MSELAWTRLQRTPANAAAVWGVYLAADDYAMNLTGVPPDRDDAAEFFDPIAPGVAELATAPLGVIEAGRMIGCAYLSCGWPDAQTAHIGLLLLTPPARGRGVGQRTVAHLESLAAQWPGVTRMRLSVVESNAHLARPFWERMGFVASGQVEPFELMQRKSFSHEYFKPLGGPA